MHNLALQQALSANEVNLYFSNIALAGREWGASNNGHVDQLLDEAPVKLRNWEWHYLTRLNHMEDGAIVGHRAPIGAIAFDPATKRLRTVSTDFVFKDWNIVTRQEAASGTFAGTATGNIGVIALSANGRTLYSRLSSMTNGVLMLIHKFWDYPPEGKYSPLTVCPLRLAATPLVVLVVSVGALKIVSPDGRRVVVVFDSGKAGASRFVLRSWDIGTGSELSSLGAYADRIVDLAFSPDGDRLALVRSASTIVLNSTTGQELVTLTIHPAAPPLWFQYSRTRRFAE